MLFPEQLIPTIAIIIIMTLTLTVIISENFYVEIKVQNFSF